MGNIHVGWNGIAHGERRVAEEEPELIGGQTLSIRVVLVKNLHVAVGRNAAEGALDASVFREDVVQGALDASVFREDVVHLVLTIHRRLPRL